MNRALCVLLLCAAAQAETADSLLLKARHHQYAEGDLPKAIELYKLALQDKALAPARQAAVHLRLAMCYAQSDLGELALPHLSKHIYELDGVSAAVRRVAAELRDKVQEDRPKPAARTPPPAEDPAVVRGRLLKERKRRAREYLRKDELAQASYQIQSARELAPGDPEVIALVAELETRLSGVMEFVRDPLEFVRRWTEARTRAVAKEAEGLMRAAIAESGKGRFNLAERSFRKAVDLIDACEFADASDELIDIRQNILMRWRSLRERELGTRNADPVLPERPRRTTLVSNYLGRLQAMLDLVSSPDREYRIITVRPRRDPASVRAHVAPRRYSLRRDIASRFNAARFARLYLPLRIEPESWLERGNFLDAAGGMLIARNRATVLDAVQEAVRGIEQPAVATVRHRFVLVSVPRVALPRFAEQFGQFRHAERVTSPVPFTLVARKHSLDDLCNYLRDEGADVRLDRDVFDVVTANGRGQTLFVAVPLSTAPGYERVKSAGETHYGLLLDTFALRDRRGCALAMRITSRFPVPALRLGGQAPVARFVTHEGELFVDTKPGQTLVVAGLVDPFADHDDSALLLLWETPGDAETPGPKAEPLGVELSLRNLLLKVHDRPGPRLDASRGFVRRDGIDVRRERARFLEALMRERLRAPEVEVDAEQAVARVPPALREDAAGLLTQLEHESRRSYVVRIHARSVRTRAFQRWMKTEELRLEPFGDAFLALEDAPSGELLMRDLVPAEARDVFAPAAPWPAMTVLGLQARHALHASLRTSPSLTTAEDLATGATRTVTEGLRVTVRPFRDGDTLRAWIEVQTAGLQSEVEELALRQAVPSYRTRVVGTRAFGFVDLGRFDRPRTALVCRIPHPKASTLETLTEIIVAVSVRALP